MIAANRPATGGERAALSATRLTQKCLHKVGNITTCVWLCTRYAVATMLPPLIGEGVSAMRALVDRWAVSIAVGMSVLTVALMVASLFMR